MKPRSLSTTRVPGWYSRSSAAISAESPIALAFGQDVKRPPGWQSRRVRQELAHGDHLPVRPFKLRQVVGDGAVQG